MSKLSKEAEANPTLKAALEKIYRAEGLISSDPKEKISEYCPVTLWHGTSAHLLPFIKQHGLGGQNILSEWKVMEFLKWTYKNLDKGEPNDCAHPDYGDLMTIRFALDDNKKKYEYGDLYVTGQYRKAESYSKRAPEILDLVRLAVNIARRQNKSIVEQKLESYDKIKSFLCLPSQPIVLELPPILLTNLKMEDESQLINELRHNRHYMEAGSFRLNAIIPFKDIVKIYPILPYSE